MTRPPKHVATRFGDIAYVERGQGPVALFVHGVFLNGHLWRHVIDRLTDVRRCVAVDLMAHGATRTSADQDVSFTAQAEVLDEVCEQLGFDQVDLVGNDSGSAISQIFAARHPARIRSLTLTNGDVHDNWPPRMFAPVVAAARAGRLGETSQKMLTDFAWIRARWAHVYETPELVSDETFRTYLEPVYGTPAAVHNLERFIAAMDCRHTVAIEPLLRRLEAPTLIVWALDDVLFDVAWAHWLRDTIPGARQVITLEGARLFFPEERPAALADALREFWRANHQLAPVPQTRPDSLSPAGRGTGGL
jgi:pimeloyl-ACP methyl ester carboxylesterase